MKKLLIGSSSFGKLIKEEAYYVDKSLLIKAFIDSVDEVTLIIRPRRWGKSLNLSMLYHFFASEIDGIKTEGLFNNLAIAKCKTENNKSYIDEFQGKYPVIYLDFKDISGDTYSEVIENLGEVVKRVCVGYNDILCKDKKLSKEEIESFKKLLNNTCKKTELKNSLLTLSSILYKSYGEAVYIFIDEYDSPINRAYSKGYFDNFSDFMRDFLSIGLKNNNYLKRGLMTGILQISKSSMLSGLNNLEVYSVITDDRYDKYFGFTEEEVDLLLEERKKNNNGNKLELDLISKPEVKKWYDGYRTPNGITIYNPWSVMEYIAHNKANAYWEQTGEMEQFIKKAITDANTEVKEQFLKLISNSVTEEIRIEPKIHYEDIGKKESALWSLLLFAGYLSLTGDLCITKDKYKLKMPNEEVKTTYTSIFQNWLENFGVDSYRNLFKHLLSEDVEAFTEDVGFYLSKIGSVYDFKNESNYHTFMLGLLCGLRDTHIIYSNKEFGVGRPDVLLIPKDKNTKLGIILEFKHAKQNDGIIQRLLDEALDQIDLNSYAIGFADFNNVTDILKIAMVFQDKSVTTDSRKDKVSYNNIDKEVSLESTEETSL